MGKSIKIDSDIWELIISHYSAIQEPTDEDKRVMSFIADKINRQIRREDFRESQARYARLRDWTNKTEG